MKHAEKEKKTEQHIKAIAKEVFSIHGYDGAKVRDIAAKANVNIALINYYFRSKKRLFEIIVEETMEEFLSGVKEILNNQEVDIQEKVKAFVITYTDFLKSSPQVPLFLINDIQKNRKPLIKKMQLVDILQDSNVLNNLNVLLKENNNLNAIQFIINLISMLIFPFLGKEIIMHIFQLGEKRFDELMDERKKQIPLWLNYMSKTNF